MGKKVTPEELKKKINHLRKPAKSKSNSEFLRSLTLVTSLGITVVFCILGGLKLGIYLDSRFHTKYLMFVFLIIGIIIAGWSAYQLLKPFIK